MEKEKKWYIEFRIDIKCADGNDYRFTYFSRAKWEEEWPKHRDDELHKMLGNEVTRCIFQSWEVEN